MQNNDAQKQKKSRVSAVTVLGSMAAVVAVVWLAFNCPTCH